MTTFERDELQLQVTIKLEPTVNTEDNDYPLPKDKSLVFNKYPRTGLEVKKGIQDKFNIPLCLQTIYFNSCQLDDTQELSSIHLREGDTLTVSYTTHGDLNTVQEIIDAMKAICTQLESIKDSILVGTLTQEEYNEISDYSFTDSIDKVFVMPTPEIINVHHLYFIHNSGVDTALNVMRLLAGIPWEKLPPKLQSLEHATLYYLWSLSATIGVRCYLFKYPDLVELVSGSILRVPVMPNERLKVKRGIGINANYGPHFSLVNSITNVIYVGVGTMSNLVELIEFREGIANTPRLIEQLASIILCPNFTAVTMHLALSALFGLTFSPSCHQLLAKPVVIERVALCKRDLHFRRVDSESRIIMIDYFVTVFFALVSPMLIKNEENWSLIPQVVAHMQKFLQNTTYQEIHQAEVDTQHFWSTIKPILSLVYRTIDEYIPESYERYVSNSTLFGVEHFWLYKTSLRVGLLTLQYVAISKNFKEIVEKEGLHDYLTCLPWYMNDEELREEAEVLRQLVQSKIKSSPPTLVNIIKGYLAINTRFNLEELMSPSFIETLDQRLLF